MIVYMLTTGSGFLIGNGGYVVTNAHVAGHCRSIAVRVGGNSYSGKLQARDDVNDLALVALTPRGTAGVALARAPTLGAEVIVAGFPLQPLLASDLQISTGVVSALSGPGNDTRLLQISAPVQSGHSGSPVLNRSGHLIGIATAKLDALLVVEAIGEIPENVAFALRSDLLALFLRGQGVVFEQRDSRSKLEVSQVAARAREFTAQVTCTN